MLAPSINTRKNQPYTFLYKLIRTALFLFYRLLIFITQANEINKTILLTTLGGSTHAK